LEHADEDAGRPNKAIGRSWGAISARPLPLSRMPRTEKCGRDVRPAAVIPPTKVRQSYVCLGRTLPSKPADQNIPGPAQSQKRAGTEECALCAYAARLCSRPGIPSGSTPPSGERCPASFPRPHRPLARSEAHPVIVMDDSIQNEGGNNRAKAAMWGFQKLRPGIRASTRPARLWALLLQNPSATMPPVTPRFGCGTKRPVFPERDTEKQMG
jgi:hypothetical protein